MEIGEGFENAIAALSRYSNLCSVEINFTPDCEGHYDGARWEEWPDEIPAVRKKLLMLIFQATKDRAVDVKNRTIQKLTITNLQNYPVPDFTSSELFRSVMGQMDELHVSLIQEHNAAGPDDDYRKIELQAFPAHLCADWLAPISINLKALSIYHTYDNWGPFSGYFDSSGINFRKLAKLALGYYTLAHDGDLDWITAIKSLRKLVLHNCMIASWVRLERFNMAEWRVPTDDWIAIPDPDNDDWCASFKYEGKWSSYLDRIVTGLPNLVDFGFDYDESMCDVRQRDDGGARIFPQRYIVFDNGILPTHWPEADEDGELHTWLETEDGLSNLHEVCLGEDEDSLDGFVKKTRSRR